MRQHGDHGSRSRCVERGTSGSCPRASVVGVIEPKIKYVENTRFSFFSSNIKYVLYVVNNCSVDIPDAVQFSFICSYSWTTKARIPAITVAP